MKIGYNPSITSAFNSLTRVNNSIERTAKILSTGRRISTSSDDAAGVAISEKISSQKAGVDRAVKNSEDGISLLQTAEGGLNQINSMLQRMRELSVQAASESLTQFDRNYIQIEMEALKKNIDDLAHNTTFNCKRLLDGSSAGTWTSDNVNTKVHIKGSLTVLDQFGQKKSAEGNYRIEVRAKAGQAQVQKSNIFTVQIDDPSDDDSEYDYDTDTGKTSGNGWNFTDGVLNITGDGNYIINGSDGATNNKIVVAQGVKAQIRLNNVNIDAGEEDGVSAFDMSGANVDLFLHGDNSLISGSGRAGLELDFSSTLRILKSNDENGSLNAIGGESAAGIGGAWNSTNGVIKVDIDLYSGGQVTAEAGSDEIDDIGGGEGSLDNSHMVNLAYDIEEEAPHLVDIPDFYNSSGTFLLDQPQDIKITQGNGKSTSILIYSTDTIADVRRKLNDAVAYDLGQNLYTDNNDKFVTFVNENDAQNTGSEAVAYTLLVRSAVAGRAGELTFSSSNQELISKLGLNTIQESKENTYTANITNAHTGSTIQRNINTNENKLIGVINPNVDIEFDHNANIKASWDENTKRYVLSSNEREPYVANVHIVNTSTAFQVGQNLGEEMQIDIADVTASALGIDEINLLSHDSASKAITTIDNAIRTISVQRTKVGSYMNELETSASSLTQTSANLEKSESLIMDADMAKEMMEFIKLQIINSTSSSMLTQAQGLTQGTIRSLMSM